MKNEIEQLFQYIQLDDNVVCQQGLGWLDQCKTLEDVWNKCPRADWMILNIGRMGYDGQRQIRKFLHRIITELPFFGGQTIWERIENDEGREAIRVLGGFGRGENSLQELNEVGLKVWQKTMHDEDIMIIVATSCMWGSIKGAIMSAKAVLGRMNAIADDEDEMELQAAEILRKCISLKSVLETYEKYIKEKIT